MSSHSLYHDGMRELQDRFDSRRLADRMEEHVLRAAFTDDDREFIGSRVMFFLATADADGWPDSSYKGGLPGFVQVIEPSVLAFPSYDGNGMYRSLGNMRVNPRVGMLFLDFETPRRLRVNGTAELHDDAALRSRFPGAELVVRVTAAQIFPNCPRYIHKMRLVEISPFAPRPEYTPPDPGWKQREEFRDALPGK